MTVDVVEEGGLSLPGEAYPFRGSRLVKDDQALLLHIRDLIVRVESYISSGKDVFHGD